MPVLYKGDFSMFLGQIQGLFMTMRLWDILDILVVAFFLYRIYI